MTRPLVNPILLESPAGCDQALREVGQMKAAVNDRIQQLTRLRCRIRPLRPEEQEEADALTDRMRVLTMAQGEIRARKGQLVSDHHATFGQCFIDAAKVTLDPATLDRVHQAALASYRAVEARRQARRTVAHVGSAIGVHGSAAPTRRVS